MKIIYLNWLPKRVNGGSFYPFIFLNSRIRNTDKGQVVLNHEKIHYEQQKELLVVFFYLLYALNFVYNLFRYKFNLYTSYKQVLFEREAFDNEDFLHYPETRDRNGWWDSF